jgi:hypothetical protein
MRTTARLIQHLLVAAALALAGAARAQGDAPRHPALTDKFYAGIGAFFPKTSTSAQLSGRTGLGTIVEFEDSLGMRSSDTVPAAFGRMRLGERWRVEAEYFELNRSGERSTNREIVWGDEVYPVNTDIRSRFDFSDLRISAGYSFFRTADKEVGVGLGFHVAAYDLSLSANAIGDEQEDVTAPLPVLSLYGQFALTERWAIGARLDRFSLSYDKYDGSLTALGLDLTYQPFRHVGFGVSYRSLFISLEAEDEGRTLKAEQTFQGPMFFMNVSF